MKTNVRFLIYLLLIAFITVSCKKNEGKGGKLSIKGKVYGKFYNKNFTKLRYEEYLPEEDVYIMYGDEDIIGDDVKTNKDGSFEFEYLNKGKYTIYAYSTDLTTQKKVAVVQEVTLTEDMTLEDLVVNKEDKSYGTFAIRGKVHVRDFDDTYTFEDGSPYYIMDEDVFLIEEGDTAETDKVSTNYNGTFEFRGLRKGKYKVYVLSEANEAIIPGGTEAVIKDVEIIDSDLLLSDFEIIKN